MCGRFTLTTPVAQLVDFFALLEPDFELEPRYNIAPTQDVACIRQSDGFRALARLRWGLVPFFARHISEGVKMINARSETVATKPAFRRPFERTRCLVPADGFFEWQKTGKDKQPYLIRPRGGEPMLFAGLWERWHNPDDGETVESCTVLTTRPNSLMEELHDRMPVILSDEDCDVWLEEKTKPADLTALLKPCDSNQLEAFPVGRGVGNVANDTEECLRRVEIRRQQSLF